MDNEKSKCVFFLGAGFSADAGIPLQRELLPELLLTSENEQIKDTLDFLTKIFSFKYEKPGHIETDKNVYPNLEDIFSAIDTAIINDEYLKDFSPNKLKKFREDLVLGILDLINKSIGNDNYIKDFSKELTDYRLKTENNDPFAIITTNWDIVLLNKFKNYHNELVAKCLSKKGVHNLKQLKEEDRKKLALLDYCLYTHSLKDRNIKNHVPSLKIKAMGFKNIKLLYLHGSPTWLYCKKCKKIFSPPSYSGISTKVVLDKTKVCPKCHTRSTLSHVLIMPTYYKIIQNVHLLDVWQNAAMELQEATSIFFIGYSLPESDYLIRNLLVSNLNKYANIYISGGSESDSDTKKNGWDTADNYRQIFGNRIKDDNILKGTGRDVIMGICRRIKEEKFEGFS